MAWATTRSLSHISKLFHSKRHGGGFYCVHTQKDVADHLGISQSMYAKLEVNGAGLTAARLVALCDFLDIEPEEAFAAIRKDQGEHSKKE